MKSHIVPFLCILLFNPLKADQTVANQQTAQPVTQNQSTQQPVQGQNKVNQANQQTPQRQLTYSPYINLGHDYSAKPPGMLNQVAASGSNSGVPGFHSDMPVPTLGPMGMLPGYMGAMAHPANMMYGSMMGAIHPMNPMSPLNPMNQMAMGSMAAQGAMAHGAAMNAMMAPQTQQPKGLSIKVESRCDSVKRQALEIANKLIKRQNKIIFKELMSYLMKSKFLIGMTEVKLTRVLRKKLYSVMRQHSTLTKNNIQFVSTAPIPHEYDAIDAEPFLKGSPTLDGIMKSI